MDRRQQLHRAIHRQLNASLSAAQMEILTQALLATYWDCRSSSQSTQQTLEELGSFALELLPDLSRAQRMHVSELIVRYATMGGEPA